MVRKVDCSIRRDDLADLWCTRSVGLRIDCRKRYCVHTNYVVLRQNTTQRLAIVFAIFWGTRTVGWPANLSVEAKGPMGISKGL
jgi:hypothetical protein